jgi:predicted glycoside hydrolase/deacetylase ChbG (UPF0249 family)
MASEVHRQLDRFRSLVGRDPTHVDSHRHRHRHEPARPIVVDMAAELGIPVRDFDATVRHCGDFYGQTYGRIYSTRPNPEAISADGLVRLLEQLSPGVTELCCHPGYADDLLASFRKEPYRGERAQEVRSLCDSRVRAGVERLGIRLCSFSDVAPLRDKHAGRA